MLFDDYMKDAEAEHGRREEIHQQTGFFVSLFVFLYFLSGFVNLCFALVKVSGINIINLG